MKLANARLCVDCDEIFEKRDSCPSCTCATLIILSTVIPPMLDARRLTSCGLLPEEELKPS